MNVATDATRGRRARATVLALSLACGATGAIVAGAASAQAPSARAQAQAAMAQVSASGVPSGATSIAFALANATSALATGEQARAAHDDGHAAIADDTALEWAETARALQAGDGFAARGEADRAAAPAASVSASLAATRLDEALARRAALRKAIDALDAEIAARPLASTTARVPTTRAPLRTMPSSSGAPTLRPGGRR